MHPSAGDTRHLAYCLNIHPGESWDEQFAVLQTFPGRVREVLGEEGPFGLGLRLSARSAEDLLARREVPALKSWLEDQNFYAFTANIFPYGSFHQTRVKESVYAPDWRTPERAAYTINCARILADLLPEGVEGSLSTVPGSFKPWIAAPEDRDQMVHHLRETARTLADIEQQTGRVIRLGLEPEPSCFLETTEETVTFFLEALLAGSGDEEPLLRRHLGLCFDACHLALQYEDLASSYRRLRSEGLDVSKVHLSAALETDNTPEGRDALAAFDEPVYLHQVIARDPDGVLHRWPDLPEALPALAGLPENLVLRVHFHVPLFWEESGGLRSTASALDPAFFQVLREEPAPHLEIETYTFDVLPDELRDGDVVNSIQREYRWVLPRLGATQREGERDAG